MGKRYSLHTKIIVTISLSNPYKSLWSGRLLPYITLTQPSSGTPLTLKRLAQSPNYPGSCLLGIMRPPSVNDNRGITIKFLIPTQSLCIG
jgi:hypothetical protein